MVGSGEDLGGGKLVFVQCFLDHGQRAARLLLRCLQSLRLDVFLQERIDFFMELGAESAECCAVAIFQLRLRVLCRLRCRLCHVHVPIKRLGFRTMAHNWRLTSWRNNVSLGDYQATLSF